MRIFKIVNIQIKSNRLIVNPLEDFIQAVFDFGSLGNVGITTNLPEMCLTVAVWTKAQRVFRCIWAALR